VALHQRAADAEGDPDDQAEHRARQPQRVHDDVVLAARRVPQRRPHGVGRDGLGADGEAGRDRNQGQHEQAEHQPDPPPPSRRGAQRLAQVDQRATPR
jgi:hypothetical protein